MASSEVEEKIREIIADQLNISEDEIQLSATFTEDLGADSLDLMELALAIEEEFEVDVSNEDLDKMSTVQQLVEHISNIAGF